MHDNVSVGSFGIQIWNYTWTFCTIKKAMMWRVLGYWGSHPWNIINRHKKSIKKLSEIREKMVHPSFALILMSKCCWWRLLFTLSFVLKMYLYLKYTWTDIFNVYGWSFWPTSLLRKACLCSAEPVMWLTSFFGFLNTFWFVKREEKNFLPCFKLIKMIFFF